MKPLVKVPPEWMARSLAWAERSVAGYNNGEKERSRALARPGIDKSVDAQLLGKAGECAFCKFMCLDPGLLDWGPKCDRGWDIEYLRHLIDVKASGTRLLIWPVTKNEFLSETPAELFAAVHRPRRDEVDTYEMLGWTTVSIFVTQHLTARPPDYLAIRISFSMRSSSIR